MDASEAGRILPNPRQRGRAGSGQSSEVNSAEKEESIQGQSNVFEEVPSLFSGPPTTTSGVYSCAGVGEVVTTQASTDVDFAMQFLNLPPNDTTLFTSVVPTSEVMILDEPATYTDQHYASDSEESDSAQTATDEIAPCQSLFTSSSSGSKDSCKMQLDSTNIIWPGMQSDIDEDPSRQLQERRKEKKRYIDRERKRYLRKTDKEYLEADREKAKLRMRMKRQDPQYRQREKDRNREQKRKIRAESKRKEQDSAVQLKLPAEMEAANNDILEQGSDVINRFPAAHCFMEKITSPLEMLTESLVTLPPSLDLEDIHSFQDYSLFPYSADTHPSLEPSFALDSNDST